MEPSRLHDKDAAYVDTPYGIFTAEGIWFHIREEALRTYAAALLEDISLEQMLRWAALWMRSPQIVTLWLLPVALWFLPPVAAALLVPGLFMTWRVLSPSVISETAVRVADWLDIPVVQGLYYVFVLSALAAQGRYTALAIGLVGFILLRWGLIERALKPLMQPLLRALYTLPLPDQILRALIIRMALNRRQSLPQLDAMQQDILDTWNYRNDQP
jgi:hypothetical protein